MGMGMHGNNNPQGKRTVILMVVLCLFLHFLLIPIWMGLVFADSHKSFLKGPMYTKVVTCDTFDNMSGRMVEVNQFPFLWTDGNSLKPSGEKLDSTFIIAYDNKEKRWTILETFTAPTGAIIACILGEGTKKININPEALVPGPGTDL